MSRRLRIPPDSRLALGHVVIPLQVHRDLLGTEVVRLPQTNELAHDVDLDRVRTSVRFARAVPEPFEALVLVAALPPVMRACSRGAGIWCTPYRL